MDAMKKDGNLFIKMMQLSLSSLYKDYIYIYKQKNYYKIIITTSIIRIIVNIYVFIRNLTSLEIMFS